MFHAPLTSILVARDRRQGFADVPPGMWPAGRGGGRGLRRCFGATIEGAEQKKIKKRTWRVRTTVHVARRARTRAGEGEKSLLPVAAVFYLEHENVLELSRHPSAG